MGAAPVIADARSTSGARETAVPASLLVTGDAFFLRRHGSLIDALRRRLAHVDTLAAGPQSTGQKLALYGAAARHAVRCLPAGTWHPRAIKRSFTKSSAHFAAVSAMTAANIRRRANAPEAILHVFGLSSPSAGEPGVPYAFYLDYTTALAKRNYPADAPHVSAADAAAFFEAERAAYTRAKRLFAMSDVVARSLVDDYNVDARRVRVVGSGGNFERPYDGPRTFGSKQVLFNASDFTRKGGELVLEAWPRIRAAEPSATLVTVGRTLPLFKGAALPAQKDGTPLEKAPHAIEGLIDRGPVDAATLRELFLGSDLALAPALLDPFPGFVIEALNYGTPAIVSNRDGMPEIVGPDAGVVLEGRSPRELADCAIALLRDEPRLQAMSEAGRRRVAERFNWDSVADAIVRDLPGMVS